MVKTYSIKSAQKVLDKLKGKTIVLVGGSFDLLHVGHLRFLENAKKLGDVLVVAINSDSHIKSYKSKGRPIIPEKQRAEMIEGFKDVNIALLTNKGLYDPYIYRVLKPSILALGKERDKKSTRIRNFLLLKKSFPNLEVKFINKDAKKISSTLIEKRILTLHKNE